jgi:hypothetical protein
MLVSQKAIFRVSNHLIIFITGFLSSYFVRMCALKMLSDILKGIAV